MLDLRQIAHAQAHHLELVMLLQGLGAEAVRAAVNFASWTVGSLNIQFDCHSPVKAWQECMYVRDVVGGVLGAVPLSNVKVEGTEASHWQAEH